LEGLAISPGDIGENGTTRGIDLLALPAGARLRLGAAALIEITGLRNPCVQLDRFMPGLMAATLDRDADGNVIRKAGVMAIVLNSGEVRSGDDIEVDMPPHPHHPFSDDAVAICVVSPAWRSRADIRPARPNFRYPKPGAGSPRRLGRS
jgi:MOSC domain-containing protein YiiM